MNLTDYTYLLSKPESVNDKQTLALEGIVSEFPFFQSARALRLKGLYNQNSFQYNYGLKVTAAYTTDRSVLFDFITSDTFTAIHKGLYEQKLAEIYGIEVKESEVVAKDSGETDTEKIEQSILTSIKESETPFAEEDLLPEPEIVEESVAVTEVSQAMEILPETEILQVPATVETIEEKLDIGKPLEFSKQERHSFQEWLQLSKVQPIQRGPVEAIAIELPTTGTTPDVQDAERMKKKALIDQFIKANPKIPPVKQDTRLATPVAPAKEDNSALMTETLARVYLEQKKYQKAIQAYEILILKYPEKSTFFADRISEVKNLQQNNT